MSETTPPPRPAFEVLRRSLPIGIRVSGQVLQEVTLRGTNGRLTRELLNATTEAHRTRVAMEHVLERIGLLSPAQVPDMVLRLTNVDIDYIHMLVHSMEAETSMLEWPFKCENERCGKPSKVRVDLAKVALLPGTGEIFWSELNFPYQKTTFQDPGTSREIEVLVRCANLGDQLQFVDRALANTQSSKTVKTRTKPGLGDFMFTQTSLTMIDYDGRGSGLSEKELDELPRRTQAALSAAMQKVHAPQIDSEVTYVCPHCKTLHELELPVSRWCDPFVDQEP